jgi:hypothetical protein
MKFCPVVPEICRGQVHGSRKERRRIRIIIIIIKIIIRNGAKTISLQTLFGRLNNKKRSKNNKSPKHCLGDLITRYDYNLTIMESPKPATDNRFQKQIKSYLWNRTMLNFCGIVAAILKMETGRNFSISGINSGHHNLPTYEISLKSNNVEFVRYCGGHFENSNQ